jgi:hypothetical protein
MSVPGLEEVSVSDIAHPNDTVRTCGRQYLAVRSKRKGDNMAHGWELRAAAGHGKGCLINSPKLHISIADRRGENSAIGAEVEGGYHDAIGCFVGVQWEYPNQLR